jgi:oxygen-independent coproporphyrinogen-3 oxidase
MRAVEQRFDISFADYFAEDLALLVEHERTGMVTIEADVIRATELGQLFVRNLGMCFDTYLRRGERDDKKPFSRTV